MRIVNHPILCNYYVTYRCNAKCGFCDIWEKPSPYVSLDTARKNLLDLKRLGVKVIDFTGGEPLLHREIDKLLHEAKKLGFITTLTTNCLLYPKLAEKLKGKIDMLHFSLDSSDGQVHDEMRGVKCFDFVMESIKIARRIGERPDVLFTAFNHNVAEIEKVYEQICLPNNLVLILNPAFEYNQVDTGTTLSAGTLELLRAWGKKPYVYLNEAFIDLRLNGGNQAANPVCKAASTTIVIGPDNELILPCYHLGEKLFPVEDDLFHLYKSNEVQNIVAMEGKLPACEGCTINCYMQPSFAVELNKYWWNAMKSTIKYNRMKGTWKELVSF